MRDEIFDRDFQAGRDALNDGIDRFLANVSNTLKVWHSIQFAAPWKSDANSTSTRAVR